MVTPEDFVNRLKVRTALHVFIIDFGSDRVEKDKAQFSNLEMLLCRFFSFCQRFYLSSASDCRLFRTSKRSLS